MTMSVIMHKNMEAHLICKSYRLQEKYFSIILNLDSKSKEWQRASRALDRFRKTKSYQLMIDNDNNVL